MALTAILQIARNRYRNRWHGQGISCSMSG